jgi:hypothetical protein
MIALQIVGPELELLLWKTISALLFLFEGYLGKSFQ